MNIGFCKVEEKGAKKRDETIIYNSKGYEERSHENMK